MSETPPTQEATPPNPSDIPAGGGLPGFAVRRPVLTAMIFLAVLIVGAVSFTRLQVDLLPEIDFPSISVVTAYEGAGPEEIETLITQPMERALSTIEGVERLESFSAEGRSRTALRFVWGTNLDSALNDVRATTERIKATLPENADSPIVYKFNLNSTPILYLGLSGQMEEPALRQLAELELGPRLERVAGVASVEVRGGLKRQLRVQLDPARMRALSVSPVQVAEALRAQNKNVPGGIVERFDKNVLVRTIGEATKVDQLGDVIVTIQTSADGQTRRAVRVRDVANILDTFEEPTNVVRINGQPGLRLSLLKQSGANTVEVAEAARAEIKRINRDYQGRAKITVLTDTSTYIKNSISNVQQSVLFGAALAVLVLLLFLRRLRPTLIVAIGIPISVIGIFTLMYYFGITLNLISFGGVALGIGMLVDNSIVVLENIFRKLEEGAPPAVAAIEGAREVSAAVVASTMTTLVVFVPVIFLSGFSAIFFGQMAFVVSFALLCSLAVSLTLLPVLSAKLLRPEDNGDGGGLAGVIGRAFDRMDEAFSKVVDWCLSHPALTMGSAIAALGGSLLLVPMIGTELLPESDQSDVRLDIEFPTGTRLEVTEQAIREAEQIIVGEVPELLSMQTIIGTPGFWSTDGEESARIELTVTSPGERTRSTETIANALVPKLQGLAAGATVRGRAGGGLWVLRVLRGGGERLEVQVRGYDLATGDRLSAEVQRAMQSVEGITAARVSRTEGGMEYRVIPDRARLADLGVRPDAVATQVQTYIQGTRATVLRERGDEFDVLVQLRPEARAHIDALREIPIFLANGQALPLREIARIVEASGPMTIERENQSRVVSVRAFLSGKRDLGSIVEELRGKLRQIKHPDDFSILVKGESEEQQKSFQGLVIGIALAILLVYMVMAAQFESFIQPVLIMCSIPFAAIGVLVALVLTKTTFNLQSFMGAIMLTGIVVNNAIVLIDYINLLRIERGMALRPAIVLSAERRLRPILMTSATTILGLLPVAIGLGEGSETQVPLARAVIGGLFVSGAISLVIIPVLYYQVERFKLRRAAA